MIARIAAFLLALATPALAGVTIQDVTSPGGIKAWLVEEHGIPFTALEIRFKGGTSLDPAGKRGAVNLMTALIEEGAGDLDAQGFATARDDLAARIGFDADADGLSVSAAFLTENRDAAAELLNLALTGARFDPDAVERVREQVLSNLRGDEKDPASIAWHLESARAFGAHPYGSDGSGSVDSVSALTRDDLLAAYKSAIARDRITVGAAGDITPEELGALLDKLFAGLPETGAPLPGRVEMKAEGGITQQDFPGPQSVVIFTQGGMRFDHPDYFAATLLNEILGGGRFNARLMREVREKRGLSYGIGTSLSSYDQAELMTGRFEASNENVAEAIRVIQDEWAKVAAEGVSDQELADAKTYMTGAYPLRFDGNDTIAAILVGMQDMGLSRDYPKTRNARVEAVTMADIRRVAASFLTPDKLHFTVVGSPPGVVSTPPPNQ